VEGVEDMMKSQNREAEEDQFPLKSLHRRIDKLCDGITEVEKELGRCVRGIRGVVLIMNSHRSPCEIQISCQGSVDELDSRKQDGCY
jgi:hypothetical protein